MLRDINKPIDLLDNDNVLAFCRHKISANIRQDNWSEYYITSIIEFKGMYIVKYGVVLDNEEEYHSTVRIVKD